MKENTITFNRDYRTYKGEIEESGGYITPLQKGNYIFEYSIPINFIKKDTESNMSTFENKLYEDTQDEIARLEGELYFLHQFIKLVGSSPKEPTKSISKPSTKFSRAKSAPKKTKPKLTKNGKKVGRPTNAEKEVKENERNKINEAIRNASPNIKKFEKELS